MYGNAPEGACKPLLEWLPNWVAYTPLYPSITMPPREGAIVIQPDFRDIAQL